MHLEGNMREWSNKTWALGDPKFLKQIDQQRNRRSQPKPRGGDHRSENFKSHNHKKGR